MSAETTPKRVVIIGGGIGGIAAGALLAKAGMQVTVFEKNDELGGRAAVLRTKGFTFDLGPSWYLMPDVFERFFAELGKKTKDLLQLQKLTPQYRVFFSDNTVYDVPRQPKKVAQLFEQIEPGAGQAFGRYLKASEIKYRLALDHVLYKNVNHSWNLLSLELLKHGLQLHPFQSMDQYVKSFFHSEKLQQIIQYTLVFLGGSPKNMPALYSLMTHVDFKLGVFYPTGGFNRVVATLLNLASEAGVTFRTNAPVTKILVDAEKRACGVVLKNGEKIEADFVIGNADYHHVESLLPDDRLRTRSEASWKKAVMAPSAFLLFLGVKGTLPELAHHNLIFAKNWQDHFSEIFDRPAWPKVPSLYINRPTATDRSVAPKGHENLMVLVPIAAGLRGDTEKQRKTYTQHIISLIEKQLNITLRDRIVFQKVMSITDFTHRYNSYQGNALGGQANTLWQTGPWRPPNQSKKVKHLFFVGAGTVPGIGVSTALISATLVRDRIIGLSS